VKGRDGIFDVTLDGELIYSKHETGRFPDAGEVEAEVAPRLASKG
jgi:selT/selW/selH-like putative selenoprotein